MYMLCILTNYLSFVEVLASRTKTRFLASSARAKTSASSSNANPPRASSHERCPDIQIYRPINFPPASRDAAASAAKLHWSHSAINIAGGA